MRKHPKFTMDMQGLPNSFGLNLYGDLYQLTSSPNSIKQARVSMRLFGKLLISLAVLVMVSCNTGNNKAYSLSIAALKPNETLVMKLEACHWGCTKGTVKFKNNKAQLGFRYINLTSKEIEVLDQYFFNGPEVAFRQRCSLPIEISFKLKNRFVTRATKNSQIYPCSFLENDKINPIELVYHFKETPNEKPIWRLSQEKRDSKLIID